MYNPIENGHVGLVREFPNQVKLLPEPAEDTDWAALELETQEVLQSLPDEALDADSPFEQMIRHPLLTHEQELALGKQIQAGSLQARNTLVDHNYRLVYSWAKKKAESTNIPVMDLFQEGSIGMMTAAGKFDPNRKLKFSTYASCWINQAIIRAIQEQSTIIRKPTHVREVERDVLQAMERIEQENLIRYSSGEPLLPNTYETIAKEANEIRKARREALHQPEPKSDRNSKIKEGRVRGVLLGGMVIASLDNPVPYLEDTTLGESYVDTDAEPVEEIAVRNAFATQIRRVIDELPARQRAVIGARFGFDDGEEKTLEEVGREFGVTRERIRQILAKATGDLRKKKQIQQLWEQKPKRVRRRSGI